MQRAWVWLALDRGLLREGIKPTIPPFELQEESA